MKILRMCMAGFGNVGKRFAQLILEKSNELRNLYDFEIRLVGIATRSKGAIVNAGGISWTSLLEMEKKLGHFDRDDPSFRRYTPIGVIESCQADTFVELTTLSIEDGQPATSYIERAFECGMDVITANKGPEAWHYEHLTKLAGRFGREFFYETIVMDGAPIFNLVRETLHGNEILGLRGILNGTTNFVLGQLKSGESYKEAIQEAQRLQIAESDPSMDMDGWDGVAKICSLANILMNAHLTPRDVEVKSLSDIALEDIKAAEQANSTIKYICTAQKNDAGVIKLQVKPEFLKPDDPLFNVNGTSAALTLYTDLAGEITIVQTNPSILQTAYGVYSDLVALIKRRGKK